MKRLVTLLLAILMLWPSVAPAKEKTPEGNVPSYDIQGAGMTTDNGQQVEISVRSKNKEIPDALLAKCAVHAVLFRDYDDNTNSGYGSSASHKSLMGSPTKEAEHADFFTPFFANGDYSNYVQVVSGSRRVAKVGKEWKVSAKVIVNSAALKKDLKKQGLVKDLGSGW